MAHRAHESLNLGINNTSDNTCKCGSWLNHWRKYRGDRFKTCSVEGCNKNDIVGGHVQRLGPKNKWYIVPLCYKHNLAPEGSEFTLKENRNPVSAVVSETCGK